MRYSPEHKASTRRRIVDGAAAALRARGLAGVGVADLMREAGLTHGGFYAHFASKDALVAEAIDAAGEQSVRNLRKVVKRAGPEPAFKAIVDAYLSTAHRDGPESGCALAALGAELARESPAARRALSRAAREACWASSPSTCPTGAGSRGAARRWPRSPVSSAPWCCRASPTTARRPRRSSPPRAAT